MRKLFFYLFIIKKVFLLLIHPLFEKEGKFYAAVKKNIENYLIFQPSKLRAKRIKRGLLKKINPQRFINSDGIKLYGWFIKPKNKMPVILHFHGQAESILSHQDIALYCIEKGIGLFLLSYRGHYKSSGKASEQGIFDDAQAAILQLKKLGVDKDKIILWGHSLGTVVALETASKNNVLGVILQSPILDVKTAATDIYKFYCDRMHIKFLGLFAKTHIKRMNFIQNMDNLSKIKNVLCPMLIMHPKPDLVTPYTNSVKLNEINPNSQLYLSEVGTHWDAQWCLDKVFEFVNSLEYNKLVSSEK